VTQKIPTNAANLPKIEQLLTETDGWQRFGECNHCGHCCQFEGSQRLTFDQRENPALFDIRYFKLRGYEVEGGQATAVVHAYKPCPKFEKTATGGGCTVYQERPKTCRNFPTNPLQMLETPCSYWFENQFGDKRIRFGGNGSPYPGLQIEEALIALPL
jgi:Fe-S-cluster containining protein